MPGDVLLDTNIVIAFFAAEPAVIARLQQTNFLVPAVVLGELYAGALRSARPVPNVARIEAMIPESRSSAATPTASRDAHFREIPNLNLEPRGLVTTGDSPRRR